MPPLDELLAFLGANAREVLVLVEVRLLDVGSLERGPSVHVLISRLTMRGLVVLAL